MILDSILLLSDTFINTNSLVVNSFLTKGSAYVSFGDELIFLKPLSQGTILYFLRDTFPMDLSGWKPPKNTFFGEEYSLDVRGNFFLDVGVLGTPMQRQGLVSYVRGRYLGYSIEGRLAFNSVSVSDIPLEDVEESYISISKGRTTLRSGIFYKDSYRIFGVSLDSFSNFSAYIGYERALFKYKEFQIDGDSLGPFQFKDRDEYVLYGSVKVFVDGMLVKDAIVDYENGIVFLKEPLVGSRILRIEYLYYKQGTFRRHLGFSYGIISFREFKDQLLYMNDSIAQADAPGYYPSYYEDPNGDYILVDSIFVFVGRGKGTYKVSFSFFPQGDYEYDSEGNYYYYVGKGKGNYMPYMYVHPPSYRREISLNTSYGRIVLLESNSNYYKYERGNYDWESSFEVSRNNLSLGVVRKIYAFEQTSFPRNVFMKTYGTFAFLRYRGLGLIYLDSLLGLEYRKDRLFIQAFKNAFLLDMNLKVNLLELQTYASDVKDRFSTRLLVRASTDISPIMILSYDSVLSYKYGLYVRISTMDAGFLYSPYTRSLNADVQISLRNFRFSANMISNYRRIYVRKFVYVGDGLGNYSYDADRGEYYPDPNGDYMLYLNQTFLHEGYEYNLSLEYSGKPLNINVSYSSVGSSLSLYDERLSLNYTDFSGYRYLDANVSLISKFFLEARMISDRLAYALGYTLGYLQLGIGYPYIFLRANKLIDATFEYYYDQHGYWRRGMLIRIRASLQRNLFNFNTNMYVDYYRYAHQENRNFGIYFSHEF